MAASKDSFGARSTLSVAGTDYDIFRLDAVEGSEKLPFSLKVLLENQLRTEDGENVTADHVRALASWDPNAEPDQEIQFMPARVVMQDFTGVPCIVDLATMREAMAEIGAVGSTAVTGRDASCAERGTGRSDATLPRISVRQ